MTSAVLTQDLVAWADLRNALAVEKHFQRVAGNEDRHAEPVEVLDEAGRANLGHTLAVDGDEALRTEDDVRNALAVLEMGSARAPADAVRVFDHSGRARLRRHAFAVVEEVVHRADALAVGHPLHAGRAVERYALAVIEGEPWRTGERRRHALALVPHIARRTRVIDAGAVPIAGTRRARDRDDALAVRVDGPRRASDHRRRWRRRDINSLADARVVDGDRAHVAAVIGAAGLVVVVDEPAVERRRVLRLDEARSVALEAVDGSVGIRRHRRIAGIEQALPRRPQRGAACIGVDGSIRLIAVAERNAAVGIVVRRREADGIFVRLEAPVAGARIADGFGDEAEHPRRPAIGEVGQFVVPGRRPALGEVHAAGAIERDRGYFDPVLKGGNLDLQPRTGADGAARADAHGPYLWPLRDRVVETVVANGQTEHAARRRGEAPRRGILGVKGR